MNRSKKTAGVRAPAPAAVAAAFRTGLGGSGSGQADLSANAKSKLIHLRKKTLILVMSHTRADGVNLTPSALVELRNKIRTAMIKMILRVTLPVALICYNFSRTVQV